jgi:uncharacterized protein YaeQ
MALKSTIHKVELQISDIGRHYYETHNLTLAQHPSETTERMMIRLAAYAWHASEMLTFTKCLSEVSEPDLWVKNYTDDILLWIDIGQPDDDRLRRASAKAEQVVMYDFHSSNDVWWQSIQSKLTRFANLSVYQVPHEQSHELSLLAARNMRLQCTVDHDDMWLTGEVNNQTRDAHLTRVKLMGA